LLGYRLGHVRTSPPLAIGALAAGGRTVAAVGAGRGERLAACCTGARAQRCQRCPAAMIGVSPAAAVRAAHHASGRRLIHHAATGGTGARIPGALFGRGAGGADWCMQPAAAGDVTGMPDRCGGRDRLPAAATGRGVAAGASGVPVGDTSAAFASYGIRQPFSLHGAPALRIGIDYFF
jgi:hypothetical protein